MGEIVKIKNIGEYIYLIRDSNVVLDFDLALLYGVENRALKQQVRRNIERFPEDFMFQLSKDEWHELITNCDKLKKFKNSPTTPLAFTEQGVAMLSSVINSQKAIEVNISIMRSFVEMRNLISQNDEILKKLMSLEKNSNLKFMQYDEQFKLIMEIIQKMTLEDEELNERKIGFKTD